MLADLSTELVLQVYNNLHSVKDVISLSLVCRRFHMLLRSSTKISTLFKAAEREFGPLHDACQVLALQSDTPHADQSPPLSFSLLRQIISVGKVAQRFESLYPELKWLDNFVDRRSLTIDERYRLRRATYRLWRYSSAFHNPAFPRSSRILLSSFEKRATLLRFSTEELLEIEDVRLIMEKTISNFIVPSDANVQRTFSDRWQTEDAIRVLETRQSAFADFFHTCDTSGCAQRKDVFSHAGWGDEISHYYLVQDLLKLDPGQIIWLKEHAPRKYQVEAYVQTLGEWFPDNGETFLHTLQTILLARGHMDLLEGLDAEDFGIARHRRLGTLLC